MITVLVPDVYAWYENPKKIGIKTLTEPKNGEALKLKMFLLKDPKGYVVEKQHFAEISFKKSINMLDHNMVPLWRVARRWI